MTIFQLNRGLPTLGNMYVKATLTTSQLSLKCKCESCFSKTEHYHFINNYSEIATVPSVKGSRKKSRGVAMKQQDINAGVAGYC